KIVAQACEKLGATADVFGCDVADEQSVTTMASAVSARFKRVDVLINNAGAFTPGPFAQTSVAEFDRMIAVNLRSAFLVTQAFLPWLLQRKAGEIFFMNSIAGLVAYPSAAGYCAAKFGVSGMARGLREETNAQGMRVCCVHRGA